MPEFENRFEDQFDPNTQNAADNFLGKNDENGVQKLKVPRLKQ
jgi:hypothetical protein